MDKSNIVFIRDTGLEKKVIGRDMTEIKEDYVKFTNRTGGVVEVKFRAPREDLAEAYAFFSDANDLETIGMDIADSGARYNHYFRGVSPLVEDGDNYKFHVTLQTRDAAPL
ncbi:hypothetical protein [Methanobacterium sp. ACI-7]|uniref:hypothetical protein n=1 Tax=unclassified Methanobacterium TaxID=2627676 RepID=UPI0039C2723B